MSKLRPLTLLASQRQRTPSWLPALSAKPVMLANVILCSCGRETSARALALSPAVTDALVQDFVPGRRQFGCHRIRHGNLRIVDTGAGFDLAALRFRDLLLALKG